MLFHSMRFRNVAINVKVPRRLGHLHNDAIHLICDGYLTSQPTKFSQAEGHVQHVLLVLGRVGQLIVHVLGEDQMASAARTDS
jgi:hypothetical protein